GAKITRVYCLHRDSADLQYGTREKLVARLNATNDKSKVHEAEWAWSSYSSDESGDYPDKFCTPQVTGKAGCSWHITFIRHDEQGDYTVYKDARCTLPSPKFATRWLD